MSIRYPDLAALFLRISFGFMMAYAHGYDKFKILISGQEIEFISILGLSQSIMLSLAVFSELFCCLMIILGYKTRLFCIPVIITMLIAVFYIYNQDSPLMLNSLEVINKETAILYLSGFITIYFLGSGRYSIDDKFDSVLS